MCDELALDQLHYFCIGLAEKGLVLLALLFSLSFLLVGLLYLPLQRLDDLLVSTGLLLESIIHFALLFCPWGRLFPFFTTG